MAKKATKAAPKYVWVARDRWGICTYGMYLMRPRLNDHLQWGPSDPDCSTLLADDLCPQQFERLMGVTLEPGECKRVPWRSPLVAIKRKAKVK